MTPRHPFSFITVVWGQRFVEQFLELALPSFLASGNLGAFAAGNGDAFTIYTSDKDRATIQSHPAFAALSRQVTTELKTFDDIVTRESRRAAYWDSWKLVNHLFSQHIPDAIRRNAALCMLQPDSVWSDGAFQKFRDQVEAGKRVLVVFSCHTDPARMIPSLLTHRQPGSIPLSIPPRPLVRYALESFHEYSSCHYYTASRFWNPGPGNFYWPVEGEGLIGHSFAGCNQVVVFPHEAPPWPITVGFELSDYIDQICERDNVYVFEDSDELMSIGLEAAVKGDPDYKLTDEGMARPASPLRVAEWIARGTRPFNHFIGEKVIRWKYSEPSERWHAMEKVREDTMRMLLAASKLFEQHPALGADLRSYAAEVEARECRESEEKSKLLGFLSEVAVGSQLQGTSLYELNELLLRDDLKHQRPVDQCLSHLVQCIRANPTSAVALVKETIEILGGQGRVEDAMNLAAISLTHYQG